MKRAVAEVAQALRDANTQYGAGLSEMDIQALVGNFAHENDLRRNGGMFNGAQKAYGTEKSYGIAQWNGARLSSLKSFSSNWQDPIEQAKFAVKELTTTEKGALRALKAARDLSSKVRAVSDKYERAAVGAYGKRTAYAESLATEIGRTAQAQAQAAGYDPSSLMVNFMPELAARNTPPPAPITPLEGAVKASPVPTRAPADRPFPSPSYEPVDPDDKGINTVYTQDGKVRAIPAPNAGMQAQWEAERINGMAAMAGKLASETEARAAQRSLQSRADLEKTEVQAGSANKSVATPNRADVAGLPDDLGPARQINVNPRMNPLLDSLTGAASRTQKTAPQAMSDVLQGPYEMARQHYEMLTGKPMPPINDAIGKQLNTKGQKSSRISDTPNSMHFQGKALDFGVKGMSAFERSALKEALQIAGLPTVNFYPGGRVAHADPRPGGGTWSGARFQPGPLGNNISVPGAPIPTPAPRGQTDSRLGYTSTTSAASAPAQAYNGGNSAIKDAYQQYGQTRDYARSTPMGLDRELDSARMGGVSTNYSKPSGSINHESIGRALQGPLGGVNYANGQIGDNKLMGAYGKDPSFAAAKPNADMSLASQYASYGRGKTDPLGVTANYALNQSLDDAVSSIPSRPAPPSLPSVPQARPQTPHEQAKQRAEKFLEENDLLGVPGKIAAQSLGQRIGSLLGGGSGGVAQALGGLGGLVSNIGAPIGSNYQGEWTPAAGGNQVAQSIGVGIGGENLRGVTNQYGATSMLGDGGSRTYGGPGGSSGK